MQSVLVVDDEASFTEALSVGLRQEGFDVATSSDGPSALAAIEANQPDLVLLDVMLPGMSGIDVCRELRKHSSVPVIMVTARTEEIDTVVGLEVGADNYVTKPYRLRELVARMRTVLRRAAAPQPADEQTQLTQGDVTLNIDRHELTIDGQPVPLALREFELLSYLMARAGRLVTRETLMRTVWGYDFVGDTKTVDVHIKRLRNKIEADPSKPARIITIRGLGYRYERAPAS